MGPIFAAPIAQGRESEDEVVVFERQRNLEESLIRSTRMMIVLRSRGKNIMNISPGLCCSWRALRRLSLHFESVTISGRLGGRQIKY